MFIPFVLLNSAELVVIGISPARSGARGKLVWPGVLSKPRGFAIWVRLAVPSVFRRKKAAG